MTDAERISRVEAERLVREVAAARSATRGALDGSWLAFLIWGVIVLASAPFTQIGDGEAVGIFWFVASPIGFLLTWRGYRALELRVGVEDRHEKLYAAIVATMVLGAIVTGVAGQGGMLSAVGPLFSIGVGLTAMALIKSLDLLVAFAGDAMIALGVLVIVIRPDEPALVAALGQGLITLGAGVVSYGRYRRNQSETTIGVAR